MFKTCLVVFLSVMILCLAMPKKSTAESGIASTFCNRVTASGIRMNCGDMVAAHPTLAFGSVVNVCVVKTGRCIRVKIIDRGPFIKGRIIDLSTGAGRVLGIDGIAQVTVN